MFLGEYAHTLDTKGRLTVPVKFREALVSGAIVTRGYDKNLHLYTREAFEQLTAQLRTLSPTDPNHRALLRLQFSGANEVDIDAQGRILLPAYLREYAGLNGDCRVIGLGEYAEIWSRTGWEEQLAIINNAGLNAERFAAINVVG